MKNVLYLLSVVVVAGLLSSSAQAQTPIGPPVATLDAGQFAAGFSYGYSKGDVKGTVFGISVTVEDIEVDTYMANLFFGAHEDWEFQIDLGASSYEDMDFSSTGDFAIGFGIKNTFAKQDKVKWGTAFTAHWYEAGASGVTLGIPWTEEVSWSEIKIAVGPSYTEDRWCLYGGPLFLFIDGEGEYTVAGLSFSAEFEEEDNVGGYVGAQIEIAENTDFGIEYQQIGSGNVLAASIRFRF